MRDTENCRYPDCVVHRPAAPRETVDQRSALTERDWAQIVEDFEDGMRIIAIARDFGVSRESITRVLRRRSVKYRPRLHEPF